MLGTPRLGTARLGSLNVTASLAAPFPGRHQRVASAMPVRPEVLAMFASTRMKEEDSGQLRSLPRRSAVAERRAVRDNARRRSFVVDRVVLNQNGSSSVQEFDK